jgi:membrane-bound metal-dependent hydrolase YbcI (DUF457 family)
MFIGHYAVAFAAKKAAPRTSLGTLFFCAQFVDLLWPVLMLLGLEHARIDPGNTAVTPLDFYDYPISHSLLAVLIWSAIIGGVYFVWRRYKQGAWVLGLCVLSHWVLDFFTHRPDLPLGFGESSKVGLGLWNSPVGSVVVEAGLYSAGVALYLLTTRQKDKIGLYGFWALVVFLAAIHLANIVGPPPPDISIVAVAGNASWLFVLWAYWVDKHRSSLTAGDAKG